MRKIVIFAVLWVFLLYMGGLCQDMETLQDGVIRLHVVGASDSDVDQNVKLKVKDAVNQHLATLLSDASNQEDARVILGNHLQELEQIAKQVLNWEGMDHAVEVSLQREAFPVRRYDSFTLPSGVYETLRIRIGEAQGRNWWCVVFPALCAADSSEEFEDLAAGAGFSDDLSDTLTGEEYEIRFYFLDLLGQIQNFFAQNEFALFFGAGL